MHTRTYRAFYSALTLSLLLGLSGCRSKYIHASLQNHSGKRLTLVQVDYPSASFGVQSLAPGEPFSYRFKLLGSGPVTVSWTDTDRHDHKQQGPRLLEGEQGTLNIDFLPNDKVNFTTSVHP